MAARKNSAKFAIVTRGGNSQRWHIEYISDRRSRLTKTFRFLKSLDIKACNIKTLSGKSMSDIYSAIQQLNEEG